MLQYRVGLRLSVHPRLLKRRTRDRRRTAIPRRDPEVFARPRALEQRLPLDVGARRSGRAFVIFAEIGQQFVGHESLEIRFIHPGAQRYRAVAKYFRHDVLHGYPVEDCDKTNAVADARVKTRTGAKKT